jgi:hypothetical protein
MTSPALVEVAAAAAVAASDLYLNNETLIHYSRPATIIAAVSASIFTIVGIVGK